jgi:DMSO reductase family type II enzyme chaperone
MNNAPNVTQNNGRKENVNPKSTFQFEERLEFEETPSVLLASERSELYRIFREAFTFPTKPFIGKVKDGTLRSQLESGILNIAELGNIPPTSTPINFNPLQNSECEDAVYEREYTRLFDVGIDGCPPCSLYGGEYTAARMHELEELVRFYNYFGLKPANETQEQELPDHITVELEFMHYLTYRQAKTLNASMDATAFLRAQRDFLGRHVGVWINKITARVEKEKSIAFYNELARVLAHFLDQEMKYLTELVGPIDRTTVSPQTYSSGRVL